MTVGPSLCTRGRDQGRDHSIFFSLLYSQSLSCIKGVIIYFCFSLTISQVRASLVAQSYRICLPMQEKRVQSLGWEDPLEKEMAIHSSILAWETVWTEKPDGLWAMGSQRVGHNLANKQQHSEIKHISTVFKAMCMFIWKLPLHVLAIFLLVWWIFSYEF